MPNRLKMIIREIELFSNDCLKSNSKVIIVKYIYEIIHICTTVVDESEE